MPEPQDPDLAKQPAAKVVSIVKWTVLVVVIGIGGIVALVLLAAYSGAFRVGG